MENTILIQLTNQKALKLIYELEELHLIKVLKKEISPANTKLSEKYRGSINEKDGLDLDRHINQMRSEWNNI